MMQDLLNAMSARAQMANDHRTSVKVGIVTSYNPDNYSVKVRLQPEDVETGWLPVLSPWVGNNWGLFAPPSPNDMIAVHFQDGDIDSGFVCQRFFNNEERPLPVPSGEFWLVHKSGSFLKFKNNGDVEINTAADLKATVGANLTATVGGNASATVSGTTDVTSSGAATLKAPTVKIDSPITTCTGELIVQGLLTYSAGMSGGGGAGTYLNGTVTINGNVVHTGNYTHTGGTMTSLSKKIDGTHTHGGVTAGGASTNTPNP